MAYQLGPDGLPIINGLASPLTPDQLAAAGIAPVDAPGGIPMPKMQNPYGGLSPDAVAGPGGGAEPYRIQLGAPQQAFSSTPFGAGISDPYASVRKPLGAPDSSGSLQALARGQEAERSAVKDMSPAELRAYNEAEANGLTSNPAMIGFAKRQEAARERELPKPKGADSLKLIPTVGEAQQQAGAPSINDPGQDAAAAWAFKHAQGGGGGPRRLQEQSESQKYTQYGAVPDELRQDIDARQRAADDTQTENISHAYEDNAVNIDRERDVIAQQQADAQQAAAHRALVNQRISKLQAHSDASEAALEAAKPKQASEFFGGNAGASILAALAVALGAGVQARTGGVNPGQVVVDGAINRWVNDQKQTYEAAKDKATLANNAYKNAIDMFGTPEAAEANIRLQALAAKNAMAQNMSKDSGNQEWLANAQLMQQNDQLKRQELRAQQIQQAGMREIDAKLVATGGAGGGGNPYLAAAKAGAEYRAAVRTASDTTNEDKRTELESEKAHQGGQKVASAASAAADAAARFREKSSSIGSRTPGENKGELEAARQDAIGKYTAYLVASGQASARTARSSAEEFYKGKGDLIRGPSADPTLDAHIKTLRGNAVRASASHAAGLSPAESGELGEPE